MTDRRDERDRKRRERRREEEAEERRRAERDRRSDELREAWRRNHPSEEEGGRAGRGGGLDDDLEDYTEEDNTCRQVRVGRQVFAEPSGTPGVCRVMCYRFAPTLQEPDYGREHEGGADHHEKAGELFLSAWHSAHTTAYPIALAPHHAVPAMLAA